MGSWCMPYVICQPCVNEKRTRCVEECPSDAIHPTPSEGGFLMAEQLFIDPARCTDCGWCANACPVQAIFALDSVPPQWSGYIKKNADYFHHSS